MSRSNEHAPGTTPRWWMEPGPAICPWCEQPHHIEAMLHCVGCDGVVCAVCVIISMDSDPSCPLCHGSPGES